MSITLQELLVKVGMDISEYTSGVDSVVGKSGALGDSLNKTAGSTDTLMQGLDKLGSSLTRIGTTMTAAITLPIVGVGVAALKMSSDLQQATIAFTTMLGSAQKAQVHLEQLRDFAMKTPFEFNDLVTASKRLQALGFSAQQIIPTLTAVGDAAAALGSGAQGIERITLALGQMQAKGKVSAEEMRQLAEAGIPAWQLLADALTKTQGKVISVGDAMKMAEKGMIDGTAAVQVLLEGMEGKFKGLMGDQMQTIGGMFSNLKDQAAKVLAEIGDALTPIGKQLLTSLTGVLTGIEGIVRAFQQMPVPIQEGVAAMIALAAATGPVLLVFGKVTEAVTSSLKAFGALSSLVSGASMFGGLATDAAGAAVAVGGVSTAVSALALVAAGLGSVLVGAFFGFKQLSENMKSFEAMDKQFNETLAKMTEGTTGPLKLGEGRYDKVIETLHAALEASAITDKEFAKLMLMVETNQKATEKEVLKNWGSGLDTSKLQIKGSVGAGLIRTDPDAAKKAMEDAFNVLGVVDLQANVKRFQDAYNLVAASGKATTEQLEAAWEKVAAAIDAATRNASGFAMGPHKAFDESSLPSLDSLIRTGAAAIVAADNFKAWKDSIADAKAQLAAMIEEENRFRQNGLDPSRIKAGLISANESVGAFASANTTIAQMQAVKAAAEDLDKQFANMANPFGSINNDAGKFIDSLNQGVVAVQKMALGTDSINEALRTLGVSMRDDSAKVQEAWATVQKGYDDGKVGVVQYERAQLAAIEDIVKQNRAAGVAITAEQSKAIYDLQQKLASANKDIWGDVRKEVSGVVNALDDSLARALFHLSDFGKIMKDSLSRIGEQLAGTILKAFSKPFADALSESITNAIAPVVSKVSGWLGGLFGGASKAGGLVGSGAIPGGVAGGLDAALGGGASAAGGVASAAGGIGSGAASAAGSLGSIANIANIANAGISLVSGVVSAMQNMHMEKTLGLIEESTRYLKIGLVTQGDSLLNDAHMIRNHLSDFFQAHVNFGQLVDLVRELTDAKDATAEIRDFLYNPIGPLIQQMAAALSGSTAPVTTGADGAVIVPNGVFDVLIQAVKDAASNIVDGIKEGVQRLVDLANGATATTTTTLPAIEPTVSTSTDTPDTQPYTAGIPYDTATTTFQTVIPANQNVVNTLLAVNQTIAQGFAATIEQLKSMGGIGGGTATGTDAPATGSDVQGAVNQLLSGGISQTAEATAQYADQAAAMRAAGVSDAVIQSFLQSGVIHAGSMGQFNQFTGVPEVVTPAVTYADQAAAMRAAGVSDAVIQSMLESGVIHAGSMGQFNQFGTGSPASTYTMPLPVLDSSWNPVTYVPGPGSMQSGTTVNIINPVFRDPSDGQAIVDLVRNQL